MGIFEDELSHDIDRVQEIRRILSARLEDIDAGQFSEVELTDIYDAMGVLEGMLERYKERRKMRHILEDVARMVNLAADGISAIDDDIQYLVEESRASYRDIRDSDMAIMTNPDYADAESINRILDETNPNKFTKKSTESDTTKYQQQNKEKER